MRCLARGRTQTTMPRSREIDDVVVAPRAFTSIPRGRGIACYWSFMPTYTLDHVSDASLLAALATLIADDRRTTAALLAHLAEVDARKLYLPAACSSMHAYCTRVLHLAEDAAYKRIRAARAARRFPILFEAIADGRLHLGGVVLLAPHLTDDNVDELVVE